MAAHVARNDFETEQEHILHQAQTFDVMAGLFSNIDFLPPEAVAVYQNFASRFLKQVMASSRDSSLKIVDVGCGAGVLFKFLLEAANEMHVSLHITGVDLSKQMVINGRVYAESVLQEFPNHSIDVFADDACRFLHQRPGEFDGVIANSCFANFWDQLGCIEAMTTGLKDGGVLVVAHPVGSRFVAGLHADNPNVTPHLMPTNAEFIEMTSSFPLTVLDFDERLKFADQTIPMYYASAAKVSRR